jgi:Cys2His2 zinc finger developmental/cell cycle regulator
MNYFDISQMVLSACSPYFQQLFVNHPEKHPIVILRDVPYADMKSLLDFMYRGEVSVDQERLSAFLRVAESLRIKGLTEVNDEKPSRESSDTPLSSTQQQTRLQNSNFVQQRKVLQQQQIPQQQQTQQQQQQQSQQTSSPIGAAMPKRKRGRPRKLSGSDDVDDYDDDYRENLLQVKILATFRSLFCSFLKWRSLIAGLTGVDGGKNGHGQLFEFRQ